MYAFRFIVASVTQAEDKKKSKIKWELQRIRLFVCILWRVLRSYAVQQTPNVALEFGRLWIKAFGVWHRIVFYKINRISHVRVITGEFNFQTWRMRSTYRLPTVRVGALETISTTFRNLFSERANKKNLFKCAYAQRYRDIHASYENLCFDEKI